MIDIGKLMFSLQKYQILQTKLNPQTSNLVPDEYAYAWYVNMYPLLNDGEWHENLKEFFKLGEEKVSQLVEEIDSEWQNGKCYTFYKLRDYFIYEKKINVDKWELIHVLRYVYLHGGFDSVFWAKLLDGDDHPIEAKSITSAFDVAKICLI